MEKIFNNIVHNEDTGFPSVQEAIKVDEHLNVQIQFCSYPGPLPSLFACGRNAKLVRYSMLDNFPSQWIDCKTNKNKRVLLTLHAALQNQTF